MRIPKMSVPIAVAVALLAACSGSGGRPGGSGFELRGAGPGSTEYAEPQREDGDIEIFERDDKIVARQRITIRNGFGGAGAAIVGMTAPVGLIVARSGPDGRYEFQYVLEGRGADEEEARAALASMSVSHADSLASGEITIEGEVVFATGGGTGTGLPLIDDGGDAPNYERQAFIGALLPAAATYALTADVTTGSVDVSQLGGTLADLSTITGSVYVEGQWDDAPLDTTTGSIDARGGFGTITADVSTGTVFASLETDRDVGGSFSASTGSVEIHVRQAGSLQGFDLTGSTNTGDVRIDVAGTQVVEETDTSAHYRTPDFDARTHQITIGADAGTGTVEIYD